MRRTHTCMARPLVDSRARDVRRRVEVIRKKLADLKQLGVVCAFTYTSVRNSGSFFTLGDQRITDVIECNKDEIVRNLLNPNLAPCGGMAGGEVHLILPLLPAPLEQLSRRSLQLLLVGIVKDLGIRWSDPRPEWWPLDVPFAPSCSTPDEISGNWTKMLQRVLESVYGHFSYDITTYIASVMQDSSTSSVGDPSSPDPSDAPSGTTPSMHTDSDSHNPLAGEPQCAHRRETIDGPTTMSGDVGFHGDQTNAPAVAISAQMVLTKDGVVGVKGYPMTRSHPPVQYTKFTVVSASSIASPRRRLARVQLDKVPVGKNHVPLHAHSQSSPPLAALQLAPPLTLASSTPASVAMSVLTPPTMTLASTPPTLTSVLTPILTPAKPPRSLASLIPTAPPPPPLLSSDQHRLNSITPKTLPADTKPLLVKHSGPLFGRLDFTVPQGVGPGKRSSPAKMGEEQGAGQRTNKLHFHMMTVVNRAKRSALIRGGGGGKGKEMHRWPAAMIEVPGGRRVSVQLAAVQLAAPQGGGQGGRVGQIGPLSLSGSGSDVASPMERERDHDGSADASSLVGGTSGKEGVGSHRVTTPPRADISAGVPGPRRSGRQSVLMSSGSVGRERGGGSATPEGQKVLTFHVYEDPVTAFRAKRSRQE